VANALDAEDMRADRVLPDLGKIRAVGLQVATAVVMEAQKSGLAGKTIGATQAEVEKSLAADMWVPSGQEALHEAAIASKADQVAAEGGGVAASKTVARQLPVDSSLVDHLAGSSKIRAVKVSIDKKRPRYIEDGTVPATGSIEKDFQSIAALLEGSEPMSVLVHLKDADGTMDAKDTDWVIITYIPEGTKQRDQMQWSCAGDSFIANYPEKRIQEWRITDSKEVSYFAFCDVAKTVLTKAGM